MTVCISNVPAAGAGALRFRSAGLLLLIGALSCRTPNAEPATAAAPLRMQLFLLAGQSNMAGRGTVEAVDRIPHPHIVMLDRNLAWVPAVDPVHFDKPVAGVGPGRSFALALASANPSIRIGLIPAAVGGSPISSWEPGALDAATRTHPYDDALARARAAMKDGDLAAILWHQGESDTGERLAPLYEQKLRVLIDRFRKDLGKPDLPILVGQLGRFDGAPWSASKSLVDAAHRKVAADVPHAAFVSSAGLKDKGDTTHFNSAAARELGMRYAEAYFRLVR
ncbi:MAG: sialate O-acetylesterase [Gemmatimonadota bacterium]